MKNEKGFSLLEVIIAIALMGIIAVAVSYALATASKVLSVADERATAESLARAQMEYIKSQVYADAPWSYELPDSPSFPPSWETPALGDRYEGYIVSVSATPLPETDDGIRKITVVVYHEHPEKTKIVKLEAYKGDR